MLENRSVMANNIKNHMANMGINRQDLCAAIKVPYSTVSEWVNGKKYPRIDKIEAMANYFGCEKSDLIEEKQKKPSEISLEGLSPAHAEAVKRVMQMSDAELQKLNLLLQIVEAK